MILAGRGEQSKLASRARCSFAAQPPWATPMPTRRVRRGSTGSRFRGLREAFFQFFTFQCAGEPLSLCGMC